MKGWCVVARRRKKKGGPYRDRRIMAERYSAMIRGSVDFENSVGFAKKFLRYAKIRATETRAIEVASMALGAYDARDASLALMEYMKKH
jgi:hypothetical protein